ncbi:MAG: YfbK domain-containing protein [Candidatus Zixiibacteriota bacterium]
MKTRKLSKLFVMALFCLLTLGFSVRAEKSSGITGRVLDIDSQMPVIGAEVTLDGTGRIEFTDFAGHFVFQVIKPGKYTLVISHRDYQTERRAGIEVKTGETVELTISLTKNIIGNLDFGIKDKLSEITLPQVSNSYEEEGFFETDRSARSQAKHKAGGQTTAPDVNYLTPRPKKEAPATKINPTPYYELPQEPFDMFFTDYGTNGFVRANRDNLSTFAADVDDASFTIAWKYISEGFTPPADAVRVEEFINHFQYGYKPPEHQRFRIFTETAASPFNPQVTFLKVGIKGREIERRERRPMNLTLVIDVSGSMGYDNRMELVKQALHLLVEQLNARDRVGMVTYGSDARVTLEPVTGDRKNIIYRAIDRLYPGGSTFAEAGIKLGYKMADRMFVEGRNNCLVLCSDGVANVGNTSADDIMRRIKKYTERNITLSAFGVGMGNYNDVLLEQLAIEGNGKYAYINDFEEARRVFVENFVGNFQVLARDVKIQVEFDPEMVEAYRLMGYENRDVADNKFRDNREEGGEIGAGHEVTALYEVVLNRHCVRGDLATVMVRWKSEDQSEVTEVSRTVKAEKIVPLERQRPEFRLAVVAAKFAEKLKGTVYAVEIEYRELSRMTADLVEEMPGEQTEKLFDMIRQTDRFDRDFSRR